MSHDDDEQLWDFDLSDWMLRALRRQRRQMRVRIESWQIGANLNAAPVSGGGTSGSSDLPDEFLDQDFESSVGNESNDPDPADEFGQELGGDPAESGGSNDGYDPDPDPDPEPQPPQNQQDTGPTRQEVLANATRETNCGRVDVVDPEITIDGCAITSEPPGEDLRAEFDLTSTYIGFESFNWELIINGNTFATGSDNIGESAAFSATVPATEFTPGDYTVEIAVVGETAANCGSFTVPGATITDTKIVSQPPGGDLGVVVNLESNVPQTNTYSLSLSVAGSVLFSEEVEFAGTDTIEITIPRSDVPIGGDLLATAATGTDTAEVGKISNKSIFSTDNIGVSCATPSYDVRIGDSVEIPIVVENNNERDASMEVHTKIDDEVADVTELLVQPGKVVDFSAVVEPDKTGEHTVSVGLANVSETQP